MTVSTPDRTPDGISFSAGEFVRVTEIARHFGVTERFVRDKIRDGILPAYRIGGRSIRVRRDDVARLLTPTDA